jgi:hypothetical protein
MHLDSSPHSPCVAFKVSHKGDDRIGIHVLYLNFTEEIEMKDGYTGGPAFPAMHFDLADHEHGMSLRDYFAAQAIQPLIENFLRNDLHLQENGWMEGLSMDAYSMADAMLKERQA